MTAFAALTLPDSAAVSKTFNVGNINYQTNLATWVLSGASYDASTLLSLSFRTPSAQSTRAKTRARLVIPIMDPVVTTRKLDELIIEVSTSIPKTATLTQRQDLRVFMEKFMSNASFYGTIDSFQGVF